MHRCRMVIPASPLLATTLGWPQARSASSRSGPTLGPECRRSSQPEWRNIGRKTELRVPRNPLIRQAKDNRVAALDLAGVLALTANWQCGAKDQALDWHAELDDVVLDGARAFECEAVDSCLGQAGLLGPAGRALDLEICTDGVLQDRDD